MTTTQLPGRALRKSTVPGIKFVVLGCFLSASSCRVLLMVELAMQCRRRLRDSHKRVLESIGFSTHKLSLTASADADSYYIKENQPLDFAYGRLGRECCMLHGTHG